MHNPPAWFHTSLDCPTALGEREAKPTDYIQQIICREADLTLSQEDWLKKSLDACRAALMQTWCFMKHLLCERIRAFNQDFWVVFLSFKLVKDIRKCPDIKTKSSTTNISIDIPVSGFPEITENAYNWNSFPEIIQIPPPVLKHLYPSFHLCSRQLTIRRDEIAFW